MTTQGDAVSGGACPHSWVALSRVAMQRRVEGGVMRSRGPVVFLSCGCGALGVLEEPTAAELAEQTPYPWRGHPERVRLARDPAEAEA